MFMGSFRGVYPRKMTPWRADLGDYWNYNIDHLGKYDIQSFVDKILETKIVEMSKLGFDE